MANKYHQGVYKVKNPKKYKGDPTNCIYRSSWERACMLWFDNHPSCIEWSSEETIVPYISPVDHKPHRYFIDFNAKFVLSNKKVQSFLVEVKPHHETQMPVKGNKREKTFLNEAMTFAVNQAKWDAAEKYATSIGAKFIVVTEKELWGNKK